MLSPRALVSFAAALSLCGIAGIQSTAAAAPTGTLSVRPTAGTPQNMPKAIAVDRRDGVSGSASVVCKTINGSAVAGRDFTAVDTTLTWADGDHLPKYCTVSISDTAPFQGKRTFILQLSNATGATLSSAASTTVYIFGNANSGAIALAAPTYTCLFDTS